ncbi:hypothetical protein EZ428_18175 [Pedobacter frigiditerrae]|uniref:Uncharacterized protein n=1 Tax=Pedobacter frigiditerrae TaxID=2530452 RepID=A0A4R0MP26_9SPHI|nr:hypothetical protein [Pedobacter frigiditerrae]TCC88568.1 hypothetical protein EZ428_18175 [Pedobacter frigiditerrae]
MKVLSKLFSCVLLFISVQLYAQKQIANKAYRIEITTDGLAAIRHLVSGKTFNVKPQFTVMKSMADPKLSFSGAAKFMKKEIGAVRIPVWEDPLTKKPVADFFKVASPIVIVARGISLEAGVLTFDFAETNDFRLTATLSLKEATEPVLSYEFIAKEAGYYTIGFTGMPELEPAKLDALWQPPVWQEKRFPEISFFSTEDMCSSLPGTMVESDGLTYGVLVEPSFLPYRLPYQPKGFIDFGVVLRNANGNAQPMIFSPVFGNTDSKMTAGQKYAFKQRIYAFKGRQPDAFMDAAKNIFGFKDYRKNVYANLNQTIENMIDFQLDDVYSRWSAEMKGFDYSTDVASTVKNVSGLHPLSTAVITDNKGIYDRRALPMIEYLISREKYLFSVNKNITRQQPSSKMAGPAVEVSELAVLHKFYNNQAPIFKYFADSLSQTSRQLNLTKVSVGSDWPNLLGLYKMTGDQQYLDKAKQGADAYIARRIAVKQIDFSDSGPKQAAQFWTDYAPLWMEMLNLYEVSKDRKYLDAAESGAKQYLQYIWFYPTIPSGTITVNEKGIVDFRCIEAVRDTIPAMIAPKQTVPAWQVSQIGLTPEASNTISWNPAIFLAQFAPHYLRLAYHTKNDFYRWVARSAVVGRYTNYPGYDIDGEFNTVYARPDYPLRKQHEVSYNQFYYNHVWPQISMLFDYLVSDAYTSSAGKINFPGAFAVGYAYLKSNVYGHETGDFYDDRDVTLWMPKQVLKVSNEQINTLTGYGNGKFYIAFLNQSNEEIDFKVDVNPQLVPIDVSKNYSGRVWKENGTPMPITIKNGIINLQVKGKGIMAISIDDISIAPQFQQKADQVQGNSPYKLIDTEVGRVNSAIFSYGKFSNAYVWLTANNEKVKKVTFNYRLKSSKTWNKITDESYPFEFSIALENNADQIEWNISAVQVAGKITQTETLRLNN